MVVVFMFEAWCMTLEMVSQVIAFGVKVGLI